MHNKLRYIQDISAEDVFDHWREREGTREEWTEVAKEKGWPDWETWRRFSFDFMKCPKREWKLYEIIDPNETIPQFLVGPYKSWQKHFDMKNAHNFADLATEQTEWLKSNGKVMQILENFPESTEFIGFYLPHKDRVVLFEGSHRCAAIALAVLEGKPIKFRSNPKIVIAELKLEEQSLLDEKLKRGTEKISF